MSAPEDATERGWGLLESLPTERWQDIYAAVRRRSRRRVAVLLLALPAVLVGQLLYLRHYWSEQADVLPFLANVGVAGIGIALILVAVIFLADAVQGLGAGALVVRGEILKKMGGAIETKTLQTVFAYLFGMEVLIDVETCAELDARGLGAKMPEWQTCRTIGAARRVHRHVKAGDEVLLACGPGGRAFAFVGEFVSDPPPTGARPGLDRSADEADGQGNAADRHGVAGAVEEAEDVGDVGLGLGDRGDAGAGADTR